MTGMLPRRGPKRVKGKEWTTECAWLFIGPTEFLPGRELTRRTWREVSK